MAEHNLLFDLPEDLVTSVYQHLTTYDRIRLNSTALRYEYRPIIEKVYHGLSTALTARACKLMTTELKWLSKKGARIILVELRLQDLPQVTEDEDIAQALRNTQVVLAGSVAASMQEGSLLLSIACC